MAAYGDKDNKLHLEFLAYGATKEQRRATDFPIYMLEVDDEVPGSTLYPIQEIIDSFGVNSNNVKWFTNSFGYMMEKRQRAVVHGNSVFRLAWRGAVTEYTQRRGSTCDALLWVPFC